MPQTGLPPWHPNLFPGHLSRARRPHPTNTGFVPASPPRIKQGKEKTHESSEVFVQHCIGDDLTPGQGARLYDPSPNKRTAASPILRPTRRKALRPHAPDRISRADGRGVGSSNPAPAPRTHSSTGAFHRLQVNTYSSTRCRPRLPPTPTQLPMDTVESMNSQEEKAGLSHNNKSTSATADPRTGSPMMTRRQPRETSPCS